MVDKNVFSDMERDVIGEVMNISLGSSATALAELLGKKVEITVPKIDVKSAADFCYRQKEPAIGVEINYIEGLKGVNIMVWKRTDAKAIIEILLNQQISDEEFLMDEINTSAIREVMNQMMGSAATALSDFLGKYINISVPLTFAIDDNNEFKNKYFLEEDEIVEVSFDLFIEGSMQSQFINVMPLPLAKEIISNLLQGTEKFAAIEKNKELCEPVNKDKEYEEIIKKEYMRINQKKKEQAPVNIKPMEYESFDGDEELISEEQLSNLELIMLVPLTISVEIGKTSKQIKDILEISPGTIIELDKQAGALVDIIVNGKLIAKGEVVVVNDNFGVRVVEILKKNELVKITL